MADPWRLLIDTNSYADFSVSISPAIERAVVEGSSPPTVFLNIFDSDSVTIGMNEDPEQTLNLKLCASEGVYFRRRPSGGGAVYAGAGSAFLVYFLPTTHAKVPQKSAEAFPQILGAMAETLSNRYGFPASYRPLNDIEVEGRKLIPTSLKIENGVMTFRIVVNITPIDTSFAGRLLPMPPEKVADKELKDLSSRFTYLEKEADRNFDERELELMTRDIVMCSFGEGLTLGRTTKLEREYAGRFRALYESEEWLFAKSERTLLQPILRNGDTVGYGRSKAVGGLIRATLALRENKIIKAIINGDWHPRPLESVSWLEEKLIGVEAEFTAIRGKIEQFLSDDEVEFAGVTIEDLMSAIKVALENQDVR
ncbi:MAG: hypothetical protein VXY05_02960 [Pseudomonadota bacterium]|nr:hypothetical protein [Pseudomonadota bacterium]